MSSRILPQHIAVIMDGNGRWARERGLPRSSGHQAGSDAAKNIVTACRELGIRHLTMYTFSKENWSRPQDEISFLFDLLVKFLKRELSNLMEQSIRLQVLGNLKDIPFTPRQAVKHAIEKTKHCTGMYLNLALNYSGRDEIIQAVQAALADSVAPEDLDEERFASYLFTKGQPDPDLIIRTSGEYRLSNFLLYQAAYSEFYFTETLWPDFTKEELEKALDDFAHRSRRFGKTGEQVKK